MTIRSAKFIAGFTPSSSGGISDETGILKDALPKIAFIGRSNVGKSSLINALTHSGVARTSALPGSTQQINLFLINNAYHLVDLPGYGYARGSQGKRDAIINLLKGYLFNSEHKQKAVVLIIDANVGMTAQDENMFKELKKHSKNILIAASKVDKMTQKEFHAKMKELLAMAGPYEVFPVSSTKKTGLDELATELFS